MRCDQYIGLNSRGKALVKELEEKFAGTFEGAFYNTFPLFKYGDDQFYEFVQESPWSSGPMFFLALKDTNGNIIEESLWTEEEIDSMI